MALNANTTSMFGGMFNDTNGLSNSCVVLVTPGSTVAIYYSDNSATVIQQAISRVTFTVVGAGAQGTTGMTGPALWSATGSIAPYGVPITYAQGFVGVGVGPTGTSFLEANSGGSTAGTGSSIPQYTLDIIGSERVNGARLFADGSAQVSAEATLDYTTFGQNWAIVSGLSTGNWQAVAVSANGQYQTVATNGAGINYSINYGQSWTASTGINVAAIVNSIAVSASGQYQLAAVQGTYAGIYYSTNYGASWTASSASSSVWYEVRISASGQYASAVINSASTVTYYSMNYGITWIASTSPSGQYATISCSASGQYQVAATGAGTVYYSSTYGQNWSASNMSTVGTLQDSAMSASGQYVSIATNAVGVWYSSNYGQTFVQVTAVIGTFNLRQIAMNASGQYQLVSGFTGGMYYSTNYGVNWTQGSSNVSWYSVAISANGQYCVGCIYGGAVYQSVTRSPSLYTSGFANVNGAIIAYNSTYTTLSVGSGLPVGLASGANYNSLLGFGAGNALTTGNTNTNVGYNSGYWNQTGLNNVCIGTNAGSGVSTNSYSGNTFVGTNAGTSTTTGYNNVYIGYNAAGSAPGNNNEIVIGQGATGNGVNTVTLGNSSTFKMVIGGITLAYSSTFSTLYLGTVFPVGLAGAANYNTFIGEGSGTANTTGAENTIVGFNAGYHNRTGSGNTSIGYGAGDGISTFSYSDNTFLGTFSGLYVVGSNNTCIGRSAGAGAAAGVSTYTNCTIVGKLAGFSLTSGGNNTLMGYNAGTSITGGTAPAGSRNVCVGANAGTSLITGYDNIYIGRDSTASAANVNNEICIGIGSGKGSNTCAIISTQQIMLDAWGTTHVLIGAPSYNMIVQNNDYNGTNQGGIQVKNSANQFQYSLMLTSTVTFNNGDTIYHVNFANNGSSVGSITTVVNGSSGNTVYSTSSDGRLKSNIDYNFNGLQILKQLKPASYTWKGGNDITYHGFIAQDIIQAGLPQYVVFPKDENDFYGMDYSLLTGIIAKSVLENNTLITTQATTITSLQTQLATANTIIANHGQTITALQSQVTAQQIQMEQILQRLVAANIA